MTNKTRTYPYKAWVLQPSFKPVEVTLVKRYLDYCSTDYGDEAAGGKGYATVDIFPSKAEAIAAGRVRVSEQQAKLEKMQLKLAKKTAALDKAEAA